MNCLQGTFQCLRSYDHFLVLPSTDVLISCRGRLITGGASHSLRLWSVVGIGEMRLPGDHNKMRSQGLTMEDEMMLGGAVVSAAFDDTMDMVRVCQVVGTRAANFE